MRFDKITLVSILVILGAVAFAVALGGRTPPPTLGDEARTPVAVVSVARRRLPGEVRAGGFLRAREDVTVSAERAGRVVALPVPEGARVAAGTVVASLDDELARANLARARVVARETALAPDAPAAELARAREALRVAEHELALRHPVAPLDGIVEVHHVDVGEYVAPGTPLVDVLDLTAVVLDVDVDPEVIGALRRGAEVPVEVSALGPADPVRSGTITRLAARASPTTRRFRVELTLPVGADGPRPGMHATAAFPVPAEEEALYVPKAAVREDRGRKGVFLVEEGVARWRPVRVAEVYHEPDLVRVLSDDGVPDGAALVVAGFSGLRDGAPVEVEVAR